MRNVTVDSEGRVFLFNEEASPLTVEERFHFFQEMLEPAEWEKVRAFYDLPKTRRRSNKSGGVRRHEGHLIGLHPKRPINVIQEERGKEAGEKSWRMPAYGKALERMIEKDTGAEGERNTDDEPEIELPDQEVPNPFKASDDDVPF
ncbi:hypothetical protein C357_01004 [Citreicella sp. 357]|nr:hypothetical protein C357_01004 [Citreicella sp. 357]